MIKVIYDIGSTHYGQEKKLLYILDTLLDSGCWGIKAQYLPEGKDSNGNISFKKEWTPRCFEICSRYNVFFGLSFWEESFLDEYLTISESFHPFAFIKFAHSANKFFLNNKNICDDILKVVTINKEVYNDRTMHFYDDCIRLETVTDKNNNPIYPMDDIGYIEFLNRTFFLDQFSYPNTKHDGLSDHSYKTFTDYTKAYCEYMLSEKGLSDIYVERHCGITSTSKERKQCNDAHFALPLPYAQYFVSMTELMFKDYLFSINKE